MSFGTTDFSPHDDSNRDRELSSSNIQASRDARRWAESWGMSKAAPVSDLGELFGGGGNENTEKEVDQKFPT